ncbi:zinc finger protein 512B-like [Harpegnathos saltator]|uniref:zinc finger protein 512B-like n=1 Tax=Harpegnathos saltator TaxID=610380 RepID=UPI000DBEE809|nr:zinc finger protein 512B-like [Harpegnathos saltator]
MLALRVFLFTLVAAATARPSFEGHGLSDEPKLISQSVHLHEVPTKIIKVTKTVAIKVPVPYPVKVPQHIPFPVPVKHPVAVPVPQIVKVPQHVPIPVEKPVPVELHQQIPLVVSKPVPIPHPVPVPHPVTLTKPIFIPVPKAIPIPQSVHSVGRTGGEDDHVSHETNYGAYSVNVQSHEASYDQGGGDQGHFQPSQPDYSDH